MKKLLLLLLLLGIGFPLLAEETVFEKREVIIVDEDDDGNYDSYTVYSSKERRVKSSRAGMGYTMKNHNVKFVAGIGLGYSGLVKNLGSLKTPDDAEFLSQKSKSINFNLDFFTYQYHFTRNFTFMTGFGLEVNNFRFDNNVSLMKDPATGATVGDYSYDQRGIHLQKSKLVTGYINFPLLLDYRFGPAKKQVYVRGGIVGGWRWFTYTKTKANSPDLKGKHRTHSSYNIRNFHWGYTAGLGFKNYGLYATYYPRPLFRSGKGPEVRQVNVGVALHF